MKNLIEKYNEIRQNPKGNAFLFFGFYFIFFVVLISFLNMSPKNNNHFEEEDETGVSYFEIGDIKNYNYQFQYTVIEDGVERKYTGKRNDNIEMFSFQNKEYYYNGEDFYVKESNDKWKITKNPYIYENFMNISKISSFFQESFMESETVYKSGKKAYRFFLDTNTIYKTFGKSNTDYVDEGNSVVVYMVEDQVESIVFQLDGYCESYFSCKKNLKIQIEYEKIGEIEEILNPIKS